MINRIRLLRSCLRGLLVPALLFSLLGAAAVLTLPNFAQAQDLRKLGPQPAPPIEGPSSPLKPPPAPALPGQDDRVLVEALAGLVFLDRSDAAVKRAAVPPEGIDVGRLPRLQTPEFRKRVAPYLGRPVSMASLSRLAADITAYYRELDLPFVSVTLPEQEITAGVVQFLIIEGRLGRLRIEGAEWFSEQLYLSDIRLKPGDPIRLSPLNEDVAWINRNPFRKADLFFDQGESVGGTDLVLRTKERLPLRVYAGYHNNGSETTDRNQGFAGFNWGNAFGWGHQLNYQYSTSPDFKQLSGHSGSYAIPLPWRDTLTLSGAYSEIEPKMDEPFRRKGMSGQAALRYDADLPALGALRQAASAIFEYKVSDNNLLFGGIPVTDNRTEILQFSGLYSGGIADPWGSSTFGLKVTASPGGLTANNKTEYFTISRSGARANYLYGLLDLARTQPLPRAFSLRLSGRLQLADGNLLGSEQLGLGGTGSVRGFNEGDAYGDWGYLLRAELHAPAIETGRWIPFRAPSAPLQLLAFYDYGVVGNVNRLAGEKREYGLKSAGLGFRYSIARYLSTSFDYGWSLGKFDGVKENSRGHFSITLSY